MPKVNFKSVARAACLGEGGKKQVDIAQASDILASAFDHLTANHTLSEIVAFFEDRMAPRAVSARRK